MLLLLLLLLFDVFKNQNTIILMFPMTFKVSFLLRWIIHRIDFDLIHAILDSLTHITLTLTLTLALNYA